MSLSILLLSASWKVSIPSYRVEGSKQTSAGSFPQLKDNQPFPAPPHWSPVHSCTSLPSCLCPAWHPALYIIYPSTDSRSSSRLWFREHFIKGVGGRAGGEPWADVMGRGPEQGLCSLSTPCPSRVPTQGKGKLHQSSGQLILSRTVFLPVQKFWVEIHFLKYCFWLHI